ncbi:MAG: sialate O-acetylesterase [Ginsengibacter sp.]
MENSKISYAVLLAFIVMIFASEYSFADVKLPAIFSDNMVLQQKAEARFWGWASPGEKISITPSWSKKTLFTEADDSGNWKVSVPTLAAGGPFDIKISGENVIVLKDVLIGEVWVCSGQSNMVFFLHSADSAKEAIAAANYPNIRYFSVQRQYGTHPFKDAPGSVWQKTTPEDAGMFSAVAYYFAKKIHHDLKVPVGIVYSAWGGTPAEAWTPGSDFKHDDSLKHYVERWNYIQQHAREDSVTWYHKLDQWEKNDSGKTSVKKPEIPQTLYYFRRPWREPGVLFNGMINPVIPFTIKGVLWYQGESNVGYANEYEYLFAKMIQSWRSDWKEKGGQKILPFYFVQISAFGYSNMNNAAIVRNAQYDVMKKIDRTGMAVTIDLGNMKNIHYTHKKQVGDRLALIAEAKSYGFKNIIYEGPTCEKINREGNKLQLDFNQQIFTIDQKKPGGFEIGYRDPAFPDSVIYVKAKSLISGNKVTAWEDEVKNPIAVRYGWLLVGEANLQNKEGLPAFPFEKKIN